MCTRKTRRVGFVLVIAALLVPAGAAWAQEAASAPATSASPAIPPDPMAVLKAIPSDATGFVVLRNMRELSGDVVNLAGMLGLPMGPNGLFPAPLDWIKETAGIQDGIDDTGSMAIVLLNCSEVDQNADIMKKVAILVPTNNAELLLKTLQAQPDQQDKSVYAVNLMGEASVAAPAGRFLVVCQAPETLRSAMKVEGEGMLKVMSPDRVAAYAESDIFGWGNLRGFSKALRDGVKNTLLGVMAMAEPAGGGDAEKSIQKLERFIEDSREVTFGIAVDRRGLNLSFYFRMDPASALGAEMKSSKAATGSLLAGLPDEPTVFAIGMVVSQGEKPELPDLVQTMLSSQGVSEHFKPEQMAALTDALTHVFGNVQSLSGSMANLPVEAKAGVMSTTFVAQVKDSDQYLEQTRKAFDVIKDVVNTAAAGKDGESAADAATAKAVADAFQWKSKAEQVTGMAVDHIVVDAAKLPDVDAEQVEQIKAVVGPEGILVRVGPVDKQNVVMVLGGGADRFAKVADIVKKGEAPLAKGAMQTLSKRLPAGPKLVEGYLHVDQLLTLVTAVMAQVGQQQTMPFAMRNAAPIAFCVNRVSDSAQEIHVVLPTELILSIREAMMPLMQMFMGGGGDQPMDMEMPPATPESEVN